MQQKKRKSEIKKTLLTRLHVKENFQNEISAHLCDLLDEAEALMGISVCITKWHIKPGLLLEKEVPVSMRGEVITKKKKKSAGMHKRENNQ